MRRSEILNAFIVPLILSIPQTNEKKTLKTSFILKIIYLPSLIGLVCF